MQFAPNSCNYSNEVLIEKSNMSKEYACLCSLKSDLWEKMYLKKSSSVACDRLCHCRHPNVGFETAFEKIENILCLFI